MRHWLSRSARRRRAPGLPDLRQRRGHPESALRRAVEQVAAFNRAVRETTGALWPCARGPISTVSTAGSGSCSRSRAASRCGSDPESIEVFWELGVRMVGLTWNRRNAFADGLLGAGRAAASRGSARSSSTGWWSSGS